MNIYKRENNKWTKTDGLAVRIAVQGNNCPWVVNEHGSVFKKKNNSAAHGGWIQYTNCPKAQDIAVKNGEVYITAKDQSIWKISESKQAGYGEWNHVSGAAVRVG